MTTFEIVNFSVSIALGLLSIGLAGFAVWLSLRFDDRSSKALESIRQISSKIQTSSEVSLEHQKEFSSKMLDSLLDKNQYGSVEGGDSPVQSAEKLEKLINARLEVAETTIGDSIAAQVRSLQSENGANSKEIAEAISSIREQVSRLGDAAREASSEAILPIAIGSRLKEFLDFPAHFLLLQAIVETGASSTEELDKLQEKYHLPTGFEDGVENLLKEGLLVGSLEHFRLPSGAQQSLIEWVQRNEPKLRMLQSRYKDKTSIVVDEGELEIARNLSF
ncbi:hypothetical protein ATO7_11683 [Oceanococcus atlanticus]|uniref:Uncharacterized protein n=1 Tax=Oceanococcus atlanticus TaxID=1317117 RepID=A0A1Y1SBE9_9GAMM|nr:hypothetical protein [Oceanococcus atlanticus]ORE85952.1 hypothetical protein ATO7_11683 [Oceanococcus atlanticus]